MKKNKNRKEKVDICSAMLLKLSHSLNPKFVETMVNGWTCSFCKLYTLFVISKRVSTIF